MQTEFQQIGKHDRITNLYVSLIYDEEGRQIVLGAYQNGLIKKRQNNQEIVTYCNTYKKTILQLVYILDQIFDSFLDTKGTFTFTSKIQYYLYHSLF